MTKPTAEDQPDSGKEPMRIYLPKKLANAIRERARQQHRTLSGFFEHAVIVAHPDLDLDPVAVSERRDHGSTKNQK